MFIFSGIKKTPPKIIIVAIIATIHVGFTFSGWPSVLKFSESKYPATKGPPKNVPTQNFLSLNILPVGIEFSIV